jgi:hypothetical protein
MSYVLGTNQWYFRNILFSTETVEKYFQKKKNEQRAKSNLINNLCMTIKKKIILRIVCMGFDCIPNHIRFRPKAILIVRRCPEDLNFRFVIFPQRDDEKYCRSREPILSTSQSSRSEQNGRPRGRLCRVNIGGAIVSLGQKIL